MFLHRSFVMPARLPVEDANEQPQRRTMFLPACPCRAADANPGRRPEAAVTPPIQNWRVVGAQAVQPLARCRGSNPQNLFKCRLRIRRQGQEYNLLVKQGQAFQQRREGLSRGRGRLLRILGRFELRRDPGQEKCAQVHQNSRSDWCEKLRSGVHWSALKTRRASCQASKHLSGVHGE